MARTPTKADDAADEAQTRTIQTERYHRNGPLVLRAAVPRFVEDRGKKRIIGHKNVGGWQVVELADAAESADVVRGDVPDDEDDGIPIMYIIDPGAKHFYNGHNVENIDVDVLEWIRDSKYVLYENADGGWHSWNGRPEFSDTRLDLREASKVDVDGMIAERRD
jgi:hypothetical protein